MELFTEIYFYKHEEKSPDTIKTIDFLKSTGWSEISSIETTDLISGGFGSCAWQEECVVVTKKFKIYIGV